MTFYSAAQGTVPMLSLRDLAIDAADRSHLETVANEVTSKEDHQFNQILPGAATVARNSAAHWDVAAPSKVIDHVIGTAGNLYGGELDLKTRFRRVAVARLALNHFQVDHQLPQSVQELYPLFFRRLAKFLKDSENDQYREEFFAKDVRYALGLTVPAGGLQVDLIYRLGPKLIVRDVMNTKSLRSALAYGSATGWRRWYSIHLDLRTMKEFTPDGWTASFSRIAEMLELNPAVRGMVGVSWFYDPQVEKITPRLGYVRWPTKHGAFLVKIGTGPQHVENATFKSPVRRKLYEEGKYLPECYAMAWPRSALLSWAERLRGDPSVAFAMYDVEAREIHRPTASRAGNARLPVAETA